MDSRKTGAIIGAIFGAIMGLSVGPIVAAVGVPGPRLMGPYPASPIYPALASALIGPVFRLVVGVGLGAVVGAIYGMFYKVPVEAIRLTILNGLTGVVAGLLAGAAVGECRR